MTLIYQNYHKHDYYTNPKISDSDVPPEAYAKRAKELGHTIISSCNHGWQGRYIEHYELAEKYDLKFLFAAEAYWVKDRFEKDRSNCHIVLAAKNENGRQALNDVLAEANITGFYYQPRLDVELILSLPPEDVWCTSACVAFWKYEDIDAIMLKFANHFKENFFLEVQYHHTQLQKDLNKRIIDLSNRHNIPIIMGCDSHYIYDEDDEERTDYLNSKGLFYEDEAGWFLGYPSGEEAYDRFKQQGILTESQIKEAMENTNVFLEVKKYDSDVFRKNIKMPTLYPELSQKEKDVKFRELVDILWQEEKKNIAPEMIPVYEKEIKKEVGDIIETIHSDYFLLNYEIIKESVKAGGMITLSGRGSGVSFITNKLLGFTSVDRIAAPVKMFPERFLSKTRIIETKSLCDIDHNVGNPEVFEKTQKELLGDDHAFPMVAYGTLKPKAAWKMLARSQNLDFEISNEVSKQIEKYEKAIKYSDSDEDKEQISVYDYIDKKYHKEFEKSEHYLGVIDSISPHPCAHLLYSGSIRKEIGLMMIKSSGGKKEKICCIMDGKWAEEYKFLKNDILKVSVVEMIYKIFDRIGIKPIGSRELIKICEDDKKTWEVYEKGFTKGINQVEQPSTTGRVIKYKPKNISELTAFIAAVRPGFRSMYSTFESREPFSYGIKALDDLIQTKQFKQSFILYQENQMAILNYSGIPLTECYEIIKNISKKRVEKVLKYKEQFLKGFEKEMQKTEGLSKQDSINVANKVWQIIEDSANYSFNSSHSYCVANDSLYGAYLKSHYPLQFYEVFLKILESKGDKDRMSEVKKESERAYGIFFPPMRFRQDNRNLTLDIDKNQITNSLKSIKGFNKALADFLYSLKDLQFDSFIDFLIYIEENGTLSTKIGDLIKIQYFEEFGKNGKLLELFEEFKNGKNKYSKKYTEKTKAKRIEALRELEASIEPYDMGIKDQMDIERELLGYIQCTYPNVDKRNCFVVDVDTKYAPRLTLFSLGSGKTQSIKIQKAIFKHKPLVPGDIIFCEKFQHKKAVKKIDGEFVEQEEKQWWCSRYEKVNHLFL